MNKNVLQKTLTLYDNGISARKIASMVGCSYPTARKHIMRHRETLRDNTNYRKYDINVNLFSIDSIDSIGHYWAGYIAADGYLRNKNGNYYLSLLVSDRDREHIELLASDLNCPTSIVRTRWSTAPRKDKSRYGRFASVIANFSSKRLIKKLEEYGIYKFKIGKPIKYNRDFLRGFFDGDGSVYIKNVPKKINKFLLYSPHKLVLESIGDWLIEEDVIYRYSIFRNRSIYQLHVGNKEDFIKIYNYLYKDATRFLKRKKIKFNERLIK